MISKERKIFYLKEKTAFAVFFIATCFSIIALITICYFMFSNFIPTISKIGFTEFIFGTKWKPMDIPPSYGILPMILGSVYVTIGAAVIGVPIGILTAIFMAKFCPPKMYRFLKPALNLMAGIPSIIYGFFALVVIVPIVKYFFGGSGMTMFTAMVLLGIMILPTIITLSETSIRAVPRSYYEGACALGASHERSVMTVVVPAAKSGIFSSIILGIGRAIGETMAVILIAGNQSRMPRGLFKGVRTMTMNIVTEMSYAADLHRDALIATGAVLFIFILIINISFLIFKRRSAH